MNKSSVDRFSLNHSQREGNNGNEVQSRSRRLTVRTRSERPRLRAVLRREDEADAAEVVFHVDGRFDVGELDLCVDLARNFELGTDFEDSVMIHCISSQWMLVPREQESQGESLPRE